MNDSQMMSGPDPGLNVVTVDEQQEIAIDSPRWGVLAAASLRTHGLSSGELNLLFVDEVEMRRLNLAHMGRDQPTDVLSFPLDGHDVAAAGHPLIGDIVVCPKYAARHAPLHHDVSGHDGSLEDELALLVVHGVLHVLGWDHEDPDEAEQMREAEQSLLSAHHR